MIRFTHAKINLGLHVTERRADGYHNLETAFWPLGWQDALEVLEAPAQQADSLHVEGLPVAGDPQQNLVMKALAAVRGLRPVPVVEVHLLKNIPMGAGLGGGSGNAAGMIQLLDQKFALGLSAQEKWEIASKLGADCAFFLDSKPVIATGIGNIFQPLSLDLGGLTLSVVHPGIGVSTAEAYRALTPRPAPKPLSEVLAQPISTWKDELVNDFESPILARYPEIGKVRSRFYQAGALYACMSGSGSAVFGLFSSAEPAEALHPLWESLGYRFWTGAA